MPISWTNSSSTPRDDEPAPPAPHRRRAGAKPDRRRRAGASSPTGCGGNTTTRIGVFVDGGSGTARDPPRGRRPGVARDPTLLSVVAARGRSTVQPTGVIVVDEPGRQMGSREVERVPRSAGRRHGELRSGDSPGGRRGAAGRPAALGHRTSASKGCRVTTTIDHDDPHDNPRDDSVLAGNCARAASCAGDVAAIVESEVRQAFPLHSRDDQQRLARTADRPARGSRRPRRPARRPDGRRDPGQRRLRYLGRPWRHGHRRPVTSTANGSSISSSGYSRRSAGGSTARHRSSMLASPTGRGSAPCCRRSRSTARCCRSDASPPTSRAIDEFRGADGRALLPRDPRGALQRFRLRRHLVWQDVAAGRVRRPRSRPASACWSSRTPRELATAAAARSGSRRGPRSPMARHR